MTKPLIIDLKIMLTPLRDDPVTEDAVIEEVCKALEEMEVLVPFGDDEACFMIEVLLRPTKN